ncbi:hypothetical protein DAI22_11g214150 [Oryza sativa Japonica Group]|nr:hypothetical protein DAI22_11g214150 [Oryza sativa Japonica Group]
MFLGPIRTDMNHGGSFPLEGFDHHARYMFLGGGGEMFEKKTRSRGVG